jgi:hypothetical protein
VKSETASLAKNNLFAIVTEAHRVRFVKWLR